MKMLKIFIIVFAIPIASYGFSMCMPPGNGSRDYVVDGNIGTWRVSNNVIGEAFCNNVYLRTLNNIGNFNKIGGANCYCRVTKIAAPNGYFANYSGGWVYVGAMNCTVENCVKNCAGRFISSVVFRRTLLASLYI